MSTRTNFRWSMMENHLQERKVSGKILKNLNRNAAEEQQESTG